MCFNQLSRVPGLNPGHQRFQHRAQIADESNVDADVLSDLGLVDIDVHLRRVRRVRLQVAGDAIVEPHAESEQQIRFLDGGVYPRLAVHAHHAEVQRMRRGDAADAEQRHGNRDPRPFGELANGLGRSREDDAVTGEDHRPLGGIDQTKRRRKRVRDRSPARAAHEASAGPHPSRIRTRSAARPS